MPCRAAAAHRRRVARACSEQRLISVVSNLPTLCNAAPIACARSA